MVYNWPAIFTMLHYQSPKKCKKNPPIRNSCKITRVCCKRFTIHRGELIIS